MMLTLEQMKMGLMLIVLIALVIPVIPVVVLLETVALIEKAGDWYMDTIVSPVAEKVTGRRI